MARRDIRQRRIQQSPKTPSKSSLVPEEMEIRDIPGKGTFLVVKHNNKLMYIKWDDNSGLPDYDGNSLTTYWDDLQVPVTAIRLGGASPADAVAYKGSIVLSFDDVTDEFIYFIAQLPHSYIEGSDIEFHIHWTPKVSGSAAGAENVKWDMTYSWANIGDSFPGETSATVSKDVQNDSADEHLLTEVVDIDGTSKKISSILLCSLGRDTAVASNYANEVYVVAIDFHFQTDGKGSRAEDIK